MKLKSIISGILGIMLLASCASDKVSTDHITLDTANISLVKGDTYKLTPTVTPDNSTDMVKWSSTDDKVATIDSDGLVTAVDYGEATILAISGNQSARCQVTVTKRLAESITINPDVLTIMKCEQKKLSATILPEDSEETTILWETSDDKIATIGEDGTLTAISVGEATIIASVGSVSGQCKVTVEGIPASGLEIDPQTADVLLGHNIKLKAVITPENSDERNVVWESDDESICTVDNDGTVTALSVGTVTITATLGSLKADCNINVTLPEANVGDYYYSDGT